MVTELSVKRIRGLQTGWLSAGDPDKPILFFIHGYPDTPESWDLQIAYFAKNYHVVAPYARGARPSDSTTSIKRYSLDATCLDHLDVLLTVDPSMKRKVVIVGHDMGGPQAWRLGPLLGNRLAGMVIINSLAIEQMTQRLRGSLSQRRKSWYFAPFLSALFRDHWIKKNPGRLLLKAHEKANLAPKLRPAIAKTVPGVVHPVNHYRAFLPDLIKGLYRKPAVLHKPVLVLWGNQDPFLEIMQRDEMKLVCSDATIRILEGSHWLHREKSETVNELMDEFLCSLAIN